MDSRDAFLTCLNDLRMFCNTLKSPQPRLCLIGTAAEVVAGYRQVDIPHIEVLSNVSDNLPGNTSRALGIVKLIPFSDCTIPLDYEMRLTNYSNDPNTYELGPEDLLLYRLGQMPVDDPKAIAELLIFCSKQKVIALSKDIYLRDDLEESKKNQFASNLLELMRFWEV